jgi:hypothetical protein
MRISALLLPLAISGAAAADPEPDALYSFGARVGGYGFRREAGAPSNDWNECRMNGLGVFGQRALPGPLFVEAGVDTYFSIGHGQPSDLPIDRESALVSVAAGVHTRFASWLRGYAQLGTGLELARLAVPYGDTTIRENKAMPEGFIGFGADIRLARGTYAGASLRVLAMGNFRYDPQRLQMANQWVAAPEPSDVFAASPAFASQGQFYLRHDL